MRKTMIAALVGISGLVGLGAVLVVGIARAGMAADAQKSVTGDLEDTFCYNVVGAKGAGHAQCALKCARKGIPVGLVEKGTEKMYILLPPKNEEGMPEDVTKNMEKEVTVKGKSYSKDGVEFLTVESVK
jgi:Non-histone chromosomal protein MC1